MIYLIKRKTRDKRRGNTTMMRKGYQEMLFYAEKYSSSHIEKFWLVKLQLRWSIFNICYL